MSWTPVLLISNMTSINTPYADLAALAAAIARRGPTVLATSLASTAPAVQPPMSGEGLTQGDRTTTSIRSAIFICAAATIAVAVLWWAKRRSDSRRHRGQYVHDGRQCAPHLHSLLLEHVVPYMLLSAHVCRMCVHVLCVQTALEHTALHCKRRWHRQCH